MRPWTISWAGSAWTDDDLTAADLCTVQLLIGGGWESCDPWRGPLQLSAMIAALVMRELGEGVDAGEVLDQVRSSSGADLLAAIDVRQVA